MDAGQTLSISRHAPDWRVQCFGVELVAVVFVILLNLLWGLRIESKPYNSGFATHTLDGPNRTGYNNIDHQRGLSLAILLIILV